MELFKFLLLLITCYLECNIFPDIQKTYLQPTTVLFMIIVLGTQMIFVDLKKHGIITIAFVVLMDMLIGLNTINYFIDMNYIPIQQTHYFLIYAVVFFVYLFIDTKDIIQLNKSFVFRNLFIFITNIVIIYSTFYSFHFSQGKYLEHTDKLNLETLAVLGKAYWVDILIVANFMIQINLIRFLFNKSKKTARHAFIWNIVKRLVVHLILTIIFYTCYNNTVRSFAYSLVMENLPQPHNVIMYNMLPNNPDQKYRLAAAMLLYILY
jgi:hypothetical protein